MSEVVRFRAMFGNNFNGPHHDFGAGSMYPAFSLCRTILMQWKFYCSVRHQDFIVKLTEVSSELDRHDSSWIVRSAAHGHGLLLESQNYPQHHLACAPGGDIRILRDADASASVFFARPGLSGDAGSISLECAASPGHFLRHQDFRLRLHPNDGSEVRVRVRLRRMTLRAPSPLKLLSTASFLLMSASPCRCRCSSSTKTPRSYRTGTAPGRCCKLRDWPPLQPWTPRR